MWCSVGQIAHCIPSSDGYLVEENCVLSGSSLLHTCMACVLYSPRGDEIVQVVCVLYKERKWSVEYRINIKL